MRAKIRQLFCLIVIVIIALAIGAAAINVYMVWGTKGRILKKDQWANFKADGVVVLGCAVRPNKEASPMLNDRMQTAISFYKEASAKKMLVSGDNLNEDYDEVSVMKKLAVSGGIEADEVYMDHTGLNTYDTIVHSMELFILMRLTRLPESLRMRRSPVMYLVRAFSRHSSRSLRERLRMYRRRVDVNIRIRNLSRSTPEISSLSAAVHSKDSR